MPPLLISEKQRGPRSLKRMALAVALRNIAAITDLGEMSFADAKPLLMHVGDPAQLHLLEVTCPQLAAEPDQMGAVWARLMGKKFPGWEKKGYLGDDELRRLPWADVYAAVKGAIDRDMAAATERLQQTLAGFSKAKEDNATQLVNSRALLKKIPGVAAVRRRGPGASISPSAALNFGGGSRTKMTTGQSVLRRARREAKEISKVSQLSTPTGHLAVARNQIRQAPAAMVNDHRVAHNPDMPTIRAPKKRQSSSLHATTVGHGGVAGTGLGTGNAANEARLLALKTGSSGRPAESSSKAAESDRPSKSSRPSSSVAPPPAVHPPKKRPRPSEPRPSEPRPRETKREAVEYDYFSDDDGGGNDYRYGKNYDGGGGGGDDEGDDDLFGDAPTTKKNKRPRLTVADLEGEDDVRPAAPAPTRKSSAAPASSAPVKKPATTPTSPAPAGKRAATSAKPKTTAAPSSSGKVVPSRATSDKAPDRSRSSLAATSAKDKPPPTRRVDAKEPSSSPPRRPAARPAAASAASAPSQPASSPTKGPGAGRKKAVDIFMRPKPKKR